IRGNAAATTTAPAPTPAVTPTLNPNGVYAGDRPALAPPAAASATVAAPGTYDTNPPPTQGASGGVHLDELMSCNEDPATGLTNWKPQEVQRLEQWLEQYRAAIIDSATRAAQRNVSTTTPPASAPLQATPAANTRALPPSNAHSVTGIRSGS